MSKVIGSMWQHRRTSDGKILVETIFSAHPVCEVNTSGNIKADENVAKLIALAPEMLMALDITLDFISRGSPPQGGSICKPNLNEVRLILKDVLGRAEGFTRASRVEI